MKVRKIIISLIFLYFIINNLFGQNLINNSSFENNSFPQSPGFEDISLSYTFIDGWTSDIVDVSCDEEGGTHWPHNYIHSPDWYNKFKRPLKDGTNLNGIMSYVNILPNSGDAFIGMGQNELAQQRIFEGSHIEQGYYILTFYIRLLQHSDPGIAHNSTFENVYLKILFAKNKIEYQKRNCNDYNCLTCTCNEEFPIKKDGLSQDIDEVASIPLTLSAYPLGSWHKVTVNILAEQSNFDYIGFEVNSPNDCKPYVLLDDISLEKGCINGCSGTDGIINYSCNNLHQVDAPLTFTGLNNISGVVLFIYERGNNAQLIYTGASMNPKNKIAWNGRNNNNGEQPENYYDYRLYLSYDCGTYIYEGSFHKNNPFTEETNWTPLFNWGPVSKPPDPGCLPEITLENQTLIQDNTLNQPLLYKAINSITAGSNVQIHATDNNTVTFEAGNHILLNPGFIAEAGSNFTAQIVSGSNKSMDLTDNSDNTDFQVSNLTDISNNISNEQKPDTTNNHISTFTSINISPNPFYRSTEVNFTINNISSIRIKIINMYGTVVKLLVDTELQKGNYTFRWDALENKSGIYLCVFETTQESVTKKIVLAR